ncbi:MAG: TonB-dependent receptor [Phenylobacterium zucineum]|nr:MAG: TonB-dependent receptor [Phenylobacterium zucineum]
MTRGHRGGLLASTFLCGALFAQVAAAQAAANDEVEAVVITGSRIPSTNLSSVSPVAVVSADEARAQGITRVEDMINSLPQAFGDFGGNISSGASGTATLNLRNLGNKRTLVLINGRRLMPGDPDRVTAQAPDINNIPAALIDRVEVVTGGASAVYGSDAIAGVVNFIMKRNFEGIQLDAQISGYQHRNDSFVRDLLAAKSFPAPDRNVFDGRTVDLNLTLGVNSPDGKGNATLYAGYRNIQSVSAADRDYSACALGSGASFTCAGSTTTNPAQFRLTNPTTGATRATLTLDPATGNTFRTYVADRDGYNYGPDNYFQRPDERYVLGGFGRYELSSKVELYAELNFMHDRSVLQVAPSGLFSRSYRINCSNPFLSAAQLAQMCTSVGLGVNDTAVVAIGRRNVEGGNRQSDMTHTAYRLVGGAKGALNEAWRYDVYAQYGTTKYDQLYLNEFSISRTQRALNAVRNPANGAIVCQSVLTGEDPACVPYNVFTIGGVTPEALKYLQIPGLAKGSTEEQVVSASLAGDLTGYGLKSPFASSGFGVAVGAEYRREALDLQPDIAFRSGDLAGQSGGKQAVSGSFDVAEVYGELRAPLVSDLPLVSEFALDLGYRYSDYSTAGGVDAYKVGLDWRLTDDVRFRGSYQQAVRAPNIVELYAARSNSLFSGADPCAGARPTATLEQCARTGVTAAQYGTIPVSGAAQYNQLIGGNPDLDPETSKTKSFGVVLTPRFLPGLSVTVDYFDIKVEDLIGVIAAPLTLNQCVTNGSPFFCNLITRSAGSGALFGDPAARVVSTNLNTGSLKTSGVDVEVTYRYSFETLGNVTAAFTGTWTEKLLVQPLPGLGAYDCVGYFGNTCGGPTPEWRHKLRLTWATPWDVQVTSAWRYIDGSSLDTSSSDPLLRGTVNASDAKIADRSYFDLSASWSPREKLTLRAGINNLFDKDPPLIGVTGLGGTFGNGNTYPQTYDALGRYLFFAVSAGF